MKLPHSRWEEAYQNNEATWRSNNSLEHWISNSRITGGAALDLGCGTGEQSIWLAKHGFKVEGLDFSQSALKIAKENCPKESGLILEFFEWDLEKLSEYKFRHLKYDLIICNKVIAFLDKPKEFLTTIHERLAGVFILEVILSHDEKQAVVIDKHQILSMIEGKFLIKEVVRVPTREGVEINDYYLIKKI